MFKIILLGAAAVALAIVADAYATDPNLGQAVSPYAGLATIYTPSAVEGRAAYVDRAALPPAQASASAPDAHAGVVDAKTARPAP
jgi:hypothetical protein